MMILIKNGDLYQPDPAGLRDVLLGGGSILAIEKEINPADLPGEVEVVDAAEHLVIPGFIDGHQHFTGGGGEDGFASRTPELTLSLNTRYGVTSAVGLLGTDAFTRSVRNLYAKTCALDKEGITARMLTGSYWHPSPTLTGKVGDDLVYLEKTIGVKLALADSRGPYIDAPGLAALAAEVRNASLIAGKPGIITVHVGVMPQRLELAADVISKYGIRADTFVFTHVNRNDPELHKQVFELAAQGSVMDATCMEEEEWPGSSAITAADFALLAKEQGLFEQLTFSSDAGGSLPQWDEQHKHIVGLRVAHPGSLLAELHRLVKQKGLPLADALKPLTRTPARIYGLADNKGRLAPGADADLLVLEPQSLRPRHVLAKGKVMIRDYKTVIKGYFEPADPA